MKQVGIIILVVVLIAMVLLAGLMLWGRFMLHNSEIPVKTQLIEDTNSQTVMTFFSHPDDEIAVGGTLLSLKEAGHRIILVCLTKGEAGPTGGLVERENLGETRATELHQVADILGAKLELFDFPDSGLKEVPLDTLKQLAFEMIQKHQPDYIISYDSRVGLYGHPDHVMTSKAIEEVFLENKGIGNFPVKKLFQLTLSPKQIQIALKIAPGFQRNYPKEGPGLPIPDFAVKTTPYFDTLVKMIEAHATQQEVFRDLLPYREETPSIIYSRIFDREYFAEVR
ncbi:N-acetylglucosaminyl deacetylase, LmbE family [Aquiflexum balticum DSM 16537]|uniref:N-acetylglucosaminyl deacetylase, LmbE family n=1 Tax=Aquiflexum balticum DSM 16537 TaxID=758820 RepID=A0A1W2HBB9_9BACT|nr:PIG-L family deacetylase [Aquiflexum balticum]SMD46173.1 N-acetylglucosaminyl deacetylase, LmbE family [Aquiflexum balticum DSM 16537]